MNLTHACHYQERYIKKHYPVEHSIILRIAGKNWTEKLYKYLHNINEPPKCKVCGAQLKFFNMSDGYGTYCRACVGKSKEVRNKAAMTSMERYGEPHYTNRQKCAMTSMERYGVTNPNKLPEVREKISQTSKERYNGIGFGSKVLLEKVKSTLQSEYGAPNFQQMGLFETYPELISFDGECWLCKCPHPECNKCISKTYFTNQRTHYARKRENVELCTNLLPIRKKDIKDTSIEIFVRNILDTHGINYSSNVRDIIPPKELDIYLPDHKIAIEINGTRWHCDKFHPAKSALHKKQLCEAKGIDLITIWEDQINRVPQIVESVLLSKLGIYKKRIGARQCKIKEIDSKTCGKFLDNNHIQGRTSSKIKLGAYVGDELVGVMTFIQSRGCQGSKERIDGQWELNRFCTLINMQVIGLVSKMLSYFIKHFNPSIVISFSHNDISKGDVYSQLNFIKDGKPNTSYYYIKSNKRYHRSNFTRAGIVRRWPEYDINDRSWTERAVMDGKNYYRIYDSGTQKWVLRI